MLEQTLRCQKEINRVMVLLCVQKTGGIHKKEGHSVSLWVFRVGNGRQERETSRQFGEQEVKKSRREKEDERGCWCVSRALSVHVPAVFAADNTASPG